MTLPALQKAPPARADAAPLAPVDLAHYRRQWPPYLARPDDMDIVAAVVVSTAWRRRTWPTTGRARLWCEFEETDLLTFLNHIAARDAWHEVHEVRRQSGGLVAPVALPFPADRRLGGEKVASFAAAVPRMRALGFLLAADGADGPALDLGLDPAATGGDDEGSGGKKAKPKPRPDEDDDGPEGLALRADELAELLELDGPKLPRP